MAWVCGGRTISQLLGCGATSITRFVHSTIGLRDVHILHNHVRGGGGGGGGGGQGSLDDNDYTLRGFGFWGGMISTKMITYLILEFLARTVISCSWHMMV